MSRRDSVGGVLDYRALAQLHRPQTQDGLRDAAAEMQRQGLKAGDIAHVMQLSTQAVEQLLRGVP